MTAVRFRNHIMSNCQALTSSHAHFLSREERFENFTLNMLRDAAAVILNRNYHILIVLPRGN